MVEITVDVINKHKHLKQVIELGDASSKTLGFFPHQAFIKSADDKLILVAVNGTGECVGYLLYRIAKERAAIVHLCISDEHRGKGIARKLVDCLTKRVKHLRGISLRCRKDYKANSLWPRLGFTSITEIDGRAQKGSRLVCWWMDLNNPTLISYAASEKFESKTAVAIDANILFDLLQPPSEITVPSHALFAGWIEDVEFWLTKEIDNEIQRQNNPIKKAASQKKAGNFHVLPGDTSNFLTVCEDIRPLWHEDMSESDRSDLRQIAWAIIAEIPYFVTRDKELLNTIAKDVDDRYGLKILNPTELIVRLDELVSSEKYQPRRFAETTLELRPIGSDDLKSLASDFQNTEVERKNDFLSSINHYLARPQEFDCSMVTDNYRKPLSLIVTRVKPGPDDEFSILMLRIASGPLASTFAYQMVSQCLHQTCRRKERLAKVTDPYLTNNVKYALQHFGFFETLDGWTKISLPVVEPASVVADEIVSMTSQIDVESESIIEWADVLRDPVNLTDSSSALYHEHYLWPAKIADADIPTYIVSIRPHWAEELFDEKLAKQGLFGRKLELALNIESVYYCSPNKNMLYPGRILWYVSKKNNVGGAGFLRACSRLDSIKIDVPKRLFKKYKHLGIYDWKDVFHVAKNDEKQKIMALRFSATELFSQPVSWNNMQDVLKRARITSQIIRPQPITTYVFLELYKKGTYTTKG